MTVTIEKPDFGHRPQQGMHAATVSAGYADNLLQYAIARGVAAEALLERAGIVAADLADPDRRIPLPNYIALMRAGIQLTGDPAFALHLGAARDFRDFSIVGLICYAAPTMGAALQELNRYGRLAAEVDTGGGDGRFQVARRDDGLWLVDTRTDAAAFPEMTESTWSRFICETARHFPGAAFALEVHVVHARPPHGDEYARIWNVPVTFASDRNAIRIDPGWLAIELHHPNRYAFGVLSEHAARLLHSLENAKSMRGRVEAALIPLLHTGDVGMERIAEALGLSRQALYRRLKDEAVGYEDLVDALRHRMALYYLSGAKASVNDTAYLVGFSEPSAFSRAFKRWTGTSPRRWKAENA